MKYVYKIVCAVLAAVVIGILFFSPIIGIRVHSEMGGLLEVNAANKGDVEMIEKILENEGKASDHISETTSLYDLAFGDTGEFFSGVSTFFDLDKNEEIKIVIPPMIAFGIAIGFTVLSALAVIIFGIFAKNNRKVIYSCIAGLGSYFLMNECFAVIEDMFVSGRLTLADLTQMWLFDMFGEIVNFELITNTLNFIPVIFGAVIVWTLLYNYTLTPAEKRERKLILGEAD